MDHIDRDRRVQDLFARALDLPSDERDAFLSRECGDDADLRDAVARLLANLGRAEGQQFLAPGSDAAGTSPPPDPRLRGHHIRCPHCRGPIEVVEARPPALVTCPACGSSFRVDQSATSSWRPDRDRFGRFELLHIVGEGSYGTVFKARDPKLRRVVALKLPRDANVLTDEDRSRFFREARNAAQLRHAAIVPVFEVDEHEDIPYIVSEFVDGVSLKDRLSDPTRLPGFREAAALIADVAEALHYAHGRGVIHRDIKPENVLIDDTQRPRVTDFGLAKREAGEVSIAVDGRPLGSPAYMSPEAAEGKAHEADARSDVYGLGVMLYQLLTGVLPFQGTWSMLLHHHLHSEPRPLRTLNDRIPRDLETVCLKAMEKAPGRRYENARALADDLRRWLAGEPISARPVGRMEKAWRWTRRHPTTAGLFAATVVATLALIAAGFFVFYNGQLQTANRAETVARETADAQRALADVARGEAQQALELANRYLYVLRINQADVAWHSNRPDRASDLLDACQPESRGWEWHFLDRQRQAPLLDFKGHSGAVLGVAYSPDGRRVASASSDGTVKVWDAATGRELLTLRGYPGTGGRQGLAYSPDGRRIAAAANGAVKVWDAATGRELPTLRGHTNTGAGDCVAYSPDGRRIAAAGDDQAVKIWDAATGRELLTLRGHISDIRDVTYSPDGRRIAAVAGGMVKVWDAATGQDALTLGVHPGAVLGVAYSPDGRRVASASSDGTVKVWDAATGRELLTLRGHSGAVLGVAYSPDGRRVASASSDGTVKVWDAATGQEGLAPTVVSPGAISVLEEALTFRGHTRVNGLAFSPDGRRIAAAAFGAVTVWDAATGQEALTLRIRSSISYGHKSIDVAFSPDGRRIAAAAFGAVTVWDAATGQEALTLGERDGRVTRLASPGLAYSPDGLRIAAARSDGTVKVWDAATGQEALTLGGRRDSLSHVTYSPDGRRIAAAARSGGAVRVWDAATGRELLTLGGHPGAVLGVAYSPDGRRIAAARSGGTVTVWDAAIGQEALTLGERDGRVTRLASPGLAYSPDGRRIAAARSGGAVKVWDAATGRELLTLGGHPGAVLGVAYSPDGRRIAAARSGGTVTVWDAAIGQEALTLGGHPGAVLGVAYSPDGRRIAAASSDGTVKVWDGTPVTPEWVAGRQALADERFAVWQRLEVQDCERRKKWFAAVWHLNQLLARDPDDADLHQRRDAARTHLDDEERQRREPIPQSELPENVFAT